MIRFEALAVENFALFPQLNFRFSTDHDKPLTLIRGENESGKTTLMRAFVWGLFGKDALPKLPEARHPVRPVWAKPGQAMKTKVDIRFMAETERATHFFRLARSVETNDDGNVVSYGAETVRLLKREGDDWADQSDQIEVLMKRHFRREMQDFYFIDADKAVDFVGGPEGRHNDQLMRETATQAVRALLGLDAMLRAGDRLEKCEVSLVRDVGRQSSNRQQQQLAKQLDEAQQALDRATSRLTELRSAEEQAERDYRAVDEMFENRLAGLQEMEEANRRFSEISQQLQEARARQTELVNTLAARLDDDRLYTALMLPVVSAVVDTLQPLKDRGYIPPTELTLLPRLIERGECVCGLDLTKNPSHRQHIERQINAAQQTKDPTRFLDGILETARRLGNRALGHSAPLWRDEVDEVYKQLGDLDPVISRLIQAYEEAKEARDARAGAGGAKELKKHRDELRAAWEAARELRRAAEQDVTDLRREVHSLSEQIRIASVAERRTQAARAAAQAAHDLQQIITAAYEVVEREQVRDVATRMNMIFRDVISATTESLFTEVGIRRAVQGGTKTQYEVYAVEDGREKPLALANGASRRAIGVAFVLALAEETSTRVPLVADSLLHAMSGSVKHKVIDYVTGGDRVGQPILFGTRTDFLDPEVRDLLKARAGRSYTVTAQSHVGGDVVRAAPTANFPKQAVMCSCGVSEFCQVCERDGDAGRVDEGRLVGPVQSEVLT